MCCVSALICSSSEAAVQRHTVCFMGLLETHSCVLCCTLSSCAEHLTGAVWLMRGRSVHFHPHLPLLKKMIDAVSGPRWLTSPTPPPTLFPLTLSTRLLSVPPFIPSASVARLTLLPVCLALANIFYCSPALCAGLVLSVNLSSLFLCQVAPSIPSLLKDSSANSGKLLFLFVSFLNCCSSDSFFWDRT